MKSLQATSYQLRATIFFILSIFLLAGCETFLKKDKARGVSVALEPQSIVKFSDIPVPTGFRFLSEESYSFESGGVRVGVLKYQGKANIEQVMSFYKDQMPMYNWNLLNIIEYGQRLMNFDRESETCIIDLEPKGKTVTVTISLGPKSQVHKKSDKAVK